MKFNSKKSIQILFIILLMTLIAVPIYMTYAMPEDIGESEENIVESQNINEENADNKDFQASNPYEGDTSSLELDGNSNDFDTNSNNNDLDNVENSENDKTEKNQNESKETIGSNNENNSTTSSNFDLKSNSNSTSSILDDSKTNSENEIKDTKEPQNESEPKIVSEENTNYSLRATIYNTNQYDTENGTDLTESGIQIDNWEHSTSKYLLINPTVPDDGNIYTVTVKLPKEMYVVGTESATPAGYSDVKITKNSDIKINNNFTYNLKPLSGTIEYTMNKGAVSGTIQLELQYDYVLWDKQANSIITKEGVNPIEVTLSKKDESITELRKLVVNKVTSSFGISLSTVVYLKSDSTSWIYSNINLKKTDTLGMRFVFQNSSILTDDRYYESLTIALKIPEYIDTNGKIYYLEPDIEKFNVSAIKYSSYNLNKNELDQGILKLEFTNAYFSNNNGISIYFKPLNEDLVNLSQDKVTFNNGKIFYNFKGNNWLEHLNKDYRNIYNITYEIQVKENVTCVASNSGVTITDRPENAIARLGGFRIRNAGTADSCEKEIYEEFDTNNTGIIKVTTINIPIDTIQEYVEVEYTLIDDNGNLVYFDSNGNILENGVEGARNSWTCSLENNNYKSNNRDNLKIKLKRDMLMENHKKYYFKSIRYRINTIKSGRYLYNHSGPDGIESSGNFYGYLNKEKLDINQKVSSKMIITSIKESNINDISAVSSTILQTKSSSSYYIDSIEINKTSVEAGDNFIISGRIVAHIYPYGNCTWIRGIRLGIILPKDISINESAISATTTQNISINEFRISSKDIDSNNKLWIIKFPDDICIGYYNENLSAISGESYINFNIQLDTSYTMNNFTFFPKDSIYVAGYKQVNVANGAASWSIKKDIYDLNENGSTTDEIGRISSSNTINCQIVSKLAELDIKDNILLNNKGNISEQKNQLDVLTNDDIVIYNLDISCNSGGNASEFLGFIPVPKKTSVIDNFLIEGDNTKFFDFKLNGVPEITGNDIYELQYTFEQGFTYDTAKNVQKWYSRDDIESNNDLNWENVTMIKVTAKNGVIENGSDTRISVNMKYSGDKYIEEAGMENMWHSGFFYKYRNGSIESAGNYSTEGVKTRITSLLELPEIELTAAKDMLPKGEGNINEYTILEKDSNKFINRQSFEITNVETYNVDLKTKAYVTKNTNMPGIEANKTFAITAKMNDGEETDILENANTKAISLGELNPEELLKLTYKIYNANAISDNAQTRYIIVTLKSDNGVTVKQKINVNREIAEATDPKSAIIAGKNYLKFDETTSEVSISEDSAFTSQFVIEYIPSIYKEQLIEFSKELPIGTNIILENITDSKNPKYWYYKMNSSKNSISFNDFIEMGTQSNKNYAYKQGDEPITESFLVIVDFSQCTENLPVGTYSIKMIFKGQDVSDFNSKELKFITTAKRSFEIITDKQEFSEQDEVIVNYKVSSQESAESKYLGRKLSLVIQASDNLPKDSYIISDNNNYHLNTNKQFIIPLKDVQSVDGIINIKLISKMLPKDEAQYNLNIELWVSATSNASAPLLGEKVSEKAIIYKNSSKPNPSLKIESMNRRILNKIRISENNSITFNLKSINNCSAYIELQKKIGTGYQKLTDKLSQVNEKTEHDKGTFDINIIEGINTINFKLNSTTEPGTYRLVIKLTDSNKNILLEVPYNFLVLDE